MKVCKVPGCGTTGKISLGLCRKHYARFNRYGRAEPVTIQERFDAKVSKGESCWEWTAFRDRLGYGKFKLGNLWAMAHRVSFEFANGPIPDGMVVDHLCYNRGCVNPAHLRVVTQAQNSQNRNGAPKNSTTGIRGVSFEKARQCYTAKFRLAGKDHYLGGFSTAAEAEAAVVKARREHMTHSEMDKAA